MPSNDDRKWSDFGKGLAVGLDYLNLNRTILEEAGLGPGVLDWFCKDGKPHFEKALLGLAREQIQLRLSGILTLQSASQFPGLDQFRRDIFGAHMRKLRPNVPISYRSSDFDVLIDWSQQYEPVKVEGHPICFWRCSSQNVTYGEILDKLGSFAVTSLAYFYWNLEELGSSKKGPPVRPEIMFVRNLQGGLHEISYEWEDDAWVLGGKEVNRQRKFDSNKVIVSSFF